MVFIALGSLALAAAARQIARLRRFTSGEQRRVFWGFLFASPWIIGFVIFVVGPALTSLYYSFTDYKLGDPINWVGLDNYRTLLTGAGAHGRRFQQAMFNSFYYALIGVPLQIGAALGMAVLLNQALKGIRVFRLIFYIPVILAGGPAILLAWRYMLTSNGGFINVVLQKLASSFFVFDWLYRGFIYVVESFNGFYAGISRGEPLGALQYMFPALIGTLVLLTLVRGEWEVGKQTRAWRAAEIIGFGTAGIAIANGIIAQPIDVLWTYVCGIVALVAIMLYAHQGKKALMRLFQVGGLIVFALGLVFTLAQADFAAGIPGQYLLALALVLVLLIYTFIGSWNRGKYTVLAVAAAVMVVIVLVRAAPGQLDGGRAVGVARYLVFSSALEQPDNLNYLQKVYPANLMSSLWIYGLVAVTLGGIALLNNRYPRIQKPLMMIALIFFALLTIGSLLDGVRYFRAFDDLAAATGAKNFHFALFNNAVAQFPDKDRVPLWMTNELWSKPSLILITMWSSGAGMLIFLAALKGVPKVFYESAEVDGANRWQKFYKITLPMISPALFYNLVIGVIASLQTFETVYILQTQQTQDSLASAAYFLFNRTFRELVIGQGSAVAWILVVIIVALTVLQFRYSRWVYYEA